MVWSVEHLTLNQRVVGSIPTAPTIGCFLLRQPLEQAAISTSFCFLFLDGATIRTCRSEPAGKVFVQQFRKAVAGNLVFVYGGFWLCHLIPPLN
jgi:hypothetical protein